MAHSDLPTDRALDHLFELFQRRLLARLAESTDQPQRAKSRLERVALTCSQYCTVSLQLFAEKRLHILRNCSSGWGATNALRGQKNMLAQSRATRSVAEDEIKPRISFGLGNVPLIG